MNFDRDPQHMTLLRSPYSRVDSNCDMVTALQTTVVLADCPCFLQTDFQQRDASDKDPGSYPNKVETSHERRHPRRRTPKGRNSCGTFPHFYDTVKPSNKFSRGKFSKSYTHLWLKGNLGKPKENPYPFFILGSPIFDT